MDSIQQAISENRAPHIEQVDPPRSPREILPTMYDLPSEDPEEPGLPDEFHDLQPQLLSRTLQLNGYPRDNCFTASDLNLYYDLKHPLWHNRPDWFLVVGVPRLYEGTEFRRSYVIWQEGVSPHIVIEFLSPGTESEDLGRFHNQPPLTLEPGVASNGDSHATDGPPEKLEVYERYLRIPHYITYSCFTGQLRYFRLNGSQYQEEAVSPDIPSIWLADLGIGLGIWQGTFEGIRDGWLRWCDRNGNWCLTDTEQEQREKELARHEREQAQAQVLQAARNLLATGLDMDQVIQLLGLTAAQLESLSSTLGGQTQERSDPDSFVS
jgi:Uma2 family endonuclease